MQKMHNALGTALRKASARSRELIEKMDREYDVYGNPVPSAYERRGVTPWGDTVGGHYPIQQILDDSIRIMEADLKQATQDQIRQNLRDSYPIWVKK